MNIANADFLENIRVNVKCSCALDLVTSLHVLTDPNHHISCDAWSKWAFSVLPKSILGEILYFGRKFSMWFLFIDIADYCTTLRCQKDSWDFSCPQDDVDLFLSDLLSMPLDQFLYFVLGGYYIGTYEIFCEQYKSNPAFLHYIESQLAFVYEPSTIRYILSNGDTIRSDFAKIVKEYYNCFFKRYWQDMAQLYKTSLSCKQYQYKYGLPLSMLFSIHPLLMQKDDKLCFEQRTFESVSVQPISDIVINLSAFAHPHKMYNIVYDIVSIYDNIILPSAYVYPDELSNLLNAVSDSNRLLIIKALLSNESSNKSLSELLNITPSAVSQHLSILKDAKIISSTRKNNRVYYSVNSGTLSHIIATFENYFDL